MVSNVDQKYCNAITSAYDAPMGREQTPNNDWSCMRPGHTWWLRGTPNGSMTRKFRFRRIPSGVVLALVGPRVDSVQSAHPLERRGAERGEDAASVSGRAHGGVEHRASNIPYFEHFRCLCSGKMCKAQKLLFSDVVEIRSCCDDRPGESGERRGRSEVPRRKTSGIKPRNWIGRELETRGGVWADTKSVWEQLAAGQKSNATCHASHWGLTPAPIKGGLQWDTSATTPIEHTAGFRHAARQLTGTYRFSSFYASCLS